MNDTHPLRVQPFLVGRETIGRAAGAVIRPMLAAYIDARPAAEVMRLSLQGVRKVDVGFVREAIINLIVHYRETRVMHLADVTDEDVLENVIAAAERSSVPVTLVEATGVRVIGRTPTRSMQAALDFALSRPAVRVGEFAAAAGISAQNASNKLRQLWEQGYLRRAEVKQASGGSEHVYQGMV